MLNRAARVMAAGHGGQILLAESTAALLSGIDLIYLGPRRLRDLPGAIGVYQVRAPGLQKDFPPLRALDASPGNLRPAVTSFVGREAEVAEVEAAVRAHRLVTLTGVGGVGKTRLATEVAAQVADEFLDGVWFFELAAVADPSAVPDAVAAVLGITQQPGKSVSESVAAALEGRVRLLVFDNCEHVLDAAADLVEAILAQSSTVRIVATSREGLGIGDEQLWPVPSLDIGSAAVELFVERARNVAPRFEIADAAEAGAVIEICRRLDGIPLAIELAASRLEGGERHRFRQLFGELPARSRGNHQLVTLTRHARSRRARIAAARLFSSSPSPRASSASASPRACSAAASESTAMVSSSDSRSSTARRTATGRPCTVTVIRSCCSPTRATNSDKWAFVSASELVSDIVISMTIGSFGVHTPL